MSALARARRRANAELAGPLRHGHETRRCPRRRGTYRDPYAAEQPHPEPLPPAAGNASCIASRRPRRENVILKHAPRVCAAAIGLAVARTTKLLIGWPALNFRVVRQVRR